MLHDYAEGFFFFFFFSLSTYLQHTDLFAFYSKYTISRDTESPALRCGGRGDTDRPTGGGGEA